MKEFTVNEDHIKLLKRMCVGWQDCEYGAPEINPKRPYGNSDVENDICEILGFKKSSCRNCEDTYTENQAQQAAKIHREMQTVIEILLSNPTTFKIGTYTKKSDYRSDWISK